MQNTLGGNDDILIQSPIHHRGATSSTSSGAGRTFLLMIGSLLAVHFQDFRV